jgi:hypothetical protein
MDGTVFSAIFQKLDNILKKWDFPFEKSKENNGKKIEYAKDNSDEQTHLLSVKTN